jgi:hypothetical protein
LNLSPGTLAGGLQALAPLFEPLNQALLDKLRSEAHWLRISEAMHIRQLGKVRPIAPLQARALRCGARDGQSWNSP